MKLNKSLFLLLAGFILLGFNIGLINWEDISSERNLALFLGVIASLFIILAQFKKLKKQNN
jgi:hypothetical protein